MVRPVGQEIRPTDGGTWPPSVPDDAGRYAGMGDTGATTVRSAVRGDLTPFTSR
jgi:hypothetical protein